ncbi:MAG: hypothetical protein LVQ95_04960 [Candidatus Micrarchaeales archaeon]|nr:hypothetical protein [Candidatus Micrarchaeales archaeon]
MEKPELILITILIGLSVFSLALAYSQLGPGWDLIAHYLNGRSLSNPAFYQCLLNPVCNQYNQNPLFYFESYRAPIAGFTLAALYLVFQGSAAIAAYLALLLVAYFLVIRFVARKLEVNELLAYAFLISPVFLYTSMVAGSEEMVSLLFLFVAIGLLARKSVWFGLFLGLATLGKYPTLALIPMLFLMFKPKKILYASVLFAIAIAPWLIFSTVFFQNPLASYELSLAIAHNNAGPFSINIGSFITVVLYPIVIGAFAALFIYKKRKAIVESARRHIPKRDLISWMQKDSRLYLYTILFTFLILSLIATLAIAPYYDIFTQVRYGYLLFASSGLLVIAVVNDLRKYTRRNLPAACGALSALLFVLLVAYLELFAVIPSISATSGVYSSAQAELTALGFQNCRIVSNDWVLMLYRNVSAFSQFDKNVSSLSYPVLLFKNGTESTNLYAVRDLQNASIAYDSYYYEVLLPQNYMCYK